MQARLLTIIGFFLVASLTMAQAPLMPHALAPDPPLPIAFEDMKRYATWPGSDEFVVTFPSSVTTSYEVNNTVPIHILLPRDQKGPFPVVMVLHYWGALNRNVERTMGEELNRRGIAAVLVTLPYHLERTPPGVRSGEMTIQADLGALNTTLLQSLQDVRRAIDFVESRPEFDHEKIGIGGLSLGAIVTALVYGVDTRVKHAAFVLGGVDIAHILWYSSRVVPQRDALRRKGYTEEKLRSEIALEPATFLSERTDTDALVIAARYDTVIPERSSQELIAALKNPKVSWMDTGHFGGVFVQNRLLTEACDYFADTFAGKEFVPRANLGAPTIRLGVQYSFDTGMDIGFGVDVFAFGRSREFAATVLATPRGIRLFFGKRMSHQLSIGAILDQRRLSPGILWSTVL
jgi:dienelactone hydrolase